MRITTPIIAAGLLAAAPATAQNQPASANATDNAVNAVAATDANMAAIDANAAAPANPALAPLPMDNTATTAPAQEKKHGFPWGVLGLLGLLGLIPRTRGNKRS